MITFHQILASFPHCFAELFRIWRFDFTIIKAFFVSCSSASPTRKTDLSSGFDGRYSTGCGGNTLGEIAEQRWIGDRGLSGRTSSPGLALLGSIVTLALYFPRTYPQWPGAWLAISVPCESKERAWIVRAE